MVKQLIIAEKREQGEKYAIALGRPKCVGESFVATPDLHIAYCVGHLVEIITNPFVDEQGNQVDLPYFPEKVEYGFSEFHGVKQIKKKDTPAYASYKAILKKKKAAFSNIKKELAWADEVIVGTDLDSEGESIFYTLLENFFPKMLKKVKWRLCANSLTPDGIKRAYQNLIPAKETYNLYLAANVRRRADWEFGVVNGTPMIKKDLIAQDKLKKKGEKKREDGTVITFYESFSVGRVKCPMMVYAIDRTFAIENHVSKPFWKLEAQDEQGVVYKHNFIFGGDDNDFNQSDAQAIVDTCQNTALVKSVEKDEKITPAPKLFNLNNLQNFMSKKHHITADQTLEIVKELRNKGYMSYPRTDSTLITEDEFAYLKAKGKDYQELLDFPFELVNTKPRKRYVNGEKVKEHYALIPTEVLPDLKALKAQERLVYEIVTKRTLLMFAQDQKTAHTKVIIDNGQEFSTTGTTLLEAGWSELMDKQVQDKLLPDFEEGQEIQVTLSIKDGVTKPPQPLTESEILNLLKRDQIGTPATRAETLKNLYLDQFLSLDASTGVISPLGKAYNAIEALSSRGSKYVNPATTGDWDIHLKLIEEGKSTPEAFLEESREEIIRFVNANPL